MFKNLLICAISMSLAAPAWALNPREVQGVNEFLKKSKVTTQEVSWVDFYQLISRDLDFDTQREMQIFLKEFPKSKLPKMKVLKLDQGGQISLRIEFKIENQTTVLTIQNEKSPAWAVIQTETNGKKQNYNLTREDIEKDFVSWIEMATGITPVSKTTPSVTLLTPEQYSKLGAQDKRNYVDKVRNLLETAEKAQAHFSTGKQVGFRKGFFDFEHLFLSEHANAAGPSGECIVAGWLGSYKSGSCQPPPEARTSGSCTTCNPTIYGEGVCAGPVSGKLAKFATGECNAKTESKKYQVFSGVKGPADISKKLESLSGKLTELRSQCMNVLAGVKTKTKLDDQEQTCTDLTTRISELEKVNCEILANHQDKNNFKELKCVQAPKETDPSVTIEKDEQAVPQTTEKPNTPLAAADECVGLPTSQGSVLCGLGKIAALNCPLNGRTDPEVRYYCDCPPGTEGVLKNSRRAIECKAAPVKPSASQGATTPRSGKSKEKKDESWFKPWMGFALAGVVGLVVWKWAAKQQIDSIYAPYLPGSPTKTPVPPPQAPVPVDVTRPAPSGQR